MSSQNPTPDNPEKNLLRRVRQFWPIYCILAALVTFGFALYDPYQLDGDAVSYMDLADLIRSHRWSAIVNGYWNPLYPALLAAGRALIHATRFNELRAYYLVNFFIFLFSAIAVVVFTDALIALRNLQTSAEPALLDRSTLRYLGLSLLVISTQRELSLGKIRPDALLQTFLLLAVASLLRYLATNRLPYAACMGAALGLAYLTKSFASLFACLCVAALVIFGLFRQKKGRLQVTAAGLVAGLCFFVIAAPYIFALSHQKGSFDAGDSGTLNYAWFNSGTARMHLEQRDGTRLGSSQIQLRHPEKQLLQSPAIYSYAEMPHGTYPDWFDPSFWNDRLTPHINPHLQISVLADCLSRLLRYGLNHPEPWLLLAIFILLGVRLSLPCPMMGWPWIAPLSLGVSIIAIYGVVHIEDRYITVGIMLILLPIFSTLRVVRGDSDTTSAIASSLILLLALLGLGESARVVGELRRGLVKLHAPAGWHDPETFSAAHALNQLGVSPGDTVACIGARACLQDQYWARLAGVRILTEIYEPSLPLYPSFEAMPHREQAIDVVRSQGGKVLIGYFEPGSADEVKLNSEGWRRLGSSAFYALPLKVLSETTPAPDATRGVFK